MCMSRKRTKLRITPDEQVILHTAIASGGSREQVMARTIKCFVTGNYTYRGAASYLGISLNTVVRVVSCARKHGVANLFKPMEAVGRPSKMQRCEVRRMVAALMASEDTGQAEAGYIVNQLKERFQIELAAGSLKYWLRKWKLRRRRRRPSKPARGIQATPELLEYIDAELLRVGEELKRLEYYFPESRNENRLLRLQQDQLLAIYKSAAGDYTQAAIAEELERREATISKWLRRFLALGGNVAAVKKLLAMHRS